MPVPVVNDLEFEYHARVLSAFVMFGSEIVCAVRCGVATDALLCSCFAPTTVSLAERGEWCGGDVSEQCVCLRSRYLLASSNVHRSSKFSTDISLPDEETIARSMTGELSE